MTTMISQKLHQNMNQPRRYQSKTGFNKQTMKTGYPEMIRGLFGKFDQAFNQVIKQNTGGPQDLTPMTTTLTQAATICSSGDLCTNQGTMPLSQRHRCLVCAFATHVACAKEAEETKKYKTTNGHCEMVCNGCLQRLEVQGEECTVSLGKKPLYWFIRPEYPKLEFSTRDDQAMMELEPTKTKAIVGARNTDVDMVTIDLQDQIMTEDGEINSVDTAPTKKDGPTKSPAKAKNDKEKVFKGYLNLRLKLEANPDPTDTLKTFNMVMDRCKAWLKAIQDLEPSFKLHTADPEAQAQKILHDLKDFPDKLDNLKSFFKGARPMSKGGFLYLKVLGSVRRSCSHNQGIICQNECTVRQIRTDERVHPSSCRRGPTYETGCCQ